MWQDSINNALKDKMRDLDGELEVMNNSIEGIWKQFMETSDSQIIEASEALQIQNIQRKKSLQANANELSDQLTTVEDQQESLIKEGFKAEEEIGKTVDVVRIEMEEKIREEVEEHDRTQNKLKELVEHLESDLMARFKAEKKEGHRTHANLVRLLEDACSKIERSFCNRTQFSY